MEILINLILLLRKGVYPYEYMDSWGEYLMKHQCLINKFLIVA